MRCSRVALSLLLAVLGGAVIALGPADSRKGMAADTGEQSPGYVETSDWADQNEVTTDWCDDHATDGGEPETDTIEPASTDAELASDELASDEGKQDECDYGYYDDEYTYEYDGYEYDGYGDKYGYDETTYSDDESYAYDYEDAYTAKSDEYAEPTESSVESNEYDYSYDYESDYGYGYDDSSEYAEETATDVSASEDDGYGDEYSYDYDDYESDYSHGYGYEDSYADDSSEAAEEPAAEVESTDEDYSYEYDNYGDEYSYDYDEYKSDYDYGYEDSYVDDSSEAAEETVAEADSSDDYSTEYDNYREQYSYDYEYDRCQSNDNYGSEYSYEYDEYGEDYSYEDEYAGEYGYEYSNPEPKYGSADFSSQVQPENEADLFDWLPGDLLTLSDQELLRSMERKIEEPSESRQAVLSHHLDCLGEMAFDFISRFEEVSGIETLDLADDLPATAAVLAAYRLFELGSLDLDESVAVLQRSLQDLSGVWVEEIRTITDSVYDLQPIEIDTGLLEGRAAGDAVLGVVAAWAQRSAGAYGGALLGMAQQIPGPIWTDPAENRFAGRMLDRVSVSRPSL